MCHQSQKENIETVKKFVIESSSADGFWDVNIGDVANIAIAAITVFLGFYVFVYQRKKDKKDQKIILKQASSAAQMEMFKLLIIEPHVDNLHTFFQNISKDLNNLNDVAITTLLIIETQKKLDDHCNQIESTFIDLLNGIEHQFYIDILKIVDVMRDGVSLAISNLDIGGLGDTSEIEPILSKFKTDMISNLYNFKNADYDLD